MKNTLGACLLGITVLEHIVTHGGETYQLNGTSTIMQIVLRYFELWAIEIPKQDVAQVYLDARHDFAGVVADIHVRVQDRTFHVDQ